MEDKGDQLGVVELDASLAGTESGRHAILWPIRMIVWEWLNLTLPWLERRVNLMLFLAEKDDSLGVVEPNASLAGTESEPHDVPWQIRMIVWEWLNGEWISCCSITEKGGLLGVFQPNAFLSDMQGELTYRNTLFHQKDSGGVRTGCFINWNGERTR